MGSKKVHTVGKENSEQFCPEEEQKDWWQPQRCVYRGLFNKVGHLKHVYTLIEIPSETERNCLCNRSKKVIPGTKSLEK